ncbi:TetR family transcriptional regulator [Novosphingobium sp.]|uniref:TetR/AcrR family transcriptional regulator n=1 Tax=Novosphingobium sp. TaxID=1874826 RepID=UPI00286D7A74|nr:TetR family transcriptional regulator [Novosphingobium sp.]
MTDIRSNWSKRTQDRVQKRNGPTAIAAGESRKSGVTRERILEAAIACLVEEGFHQLSVAKVAARADLTRAATVYHFAGRDELLKAVATYLLDKRARLYWEAVRNVPEGPSQISQFIDIYWDQVESDLFCAFVELLMAARTDKALGKMLMPLLDQYELDRAHYSRMVFTHEMRENAGEAFETIRDVARFLIEGMGFAAMTSRIQPGRIAQVKCFMTEQMEKAYHRSREDSGSA